MTPAAASEALLDPLPASSRCNGCHIAIRFTISVVFTCTLSKKDLTNGFVGSFAKLIKRFLNDSDTVIRVFPSRRVLRSMLHL